MKIHLSVVVIGLTLTGGLTTYWLSAKQDVSKRQLDSPGARAQRQETRDLMACQNFLDQGDPIAAQSCVETFLARGSLRPAFAEGANWILAEAQVKRGQPARA